MWKSLFSFLSMRVRSRQPVKRCKKMIADNFPRSQITDTLEKRCCKELRAKNFVSAKVIVYIYRKLLTSCNKQISLKLEKMRGCCVFEQLGSKHFVHWEDAKNPSFWSRACLHKMAMLGEEVTTTRGQLTSVAKHAKSGSSIAMHGAVGDIMLHLHKCILMSLDDTTQC